MSICLCYRHTFYCKMRRGVIEVAFTGTELCQLCVILITVTGMIVLDHSVFWHAVSLRSWVCIGSVSVTVFSQAPSFQNIFLNWLLCLCRYTANPAKTICQNTCCIHNTVTTKDVSPEKKTKLLLCPLAFQKRSKWSQSVLTFAKILKRLYLDYKL